MGNKDNNRSYHRWLNWLTISTAVVFLFCSCSALLLYLADRGVSLPEIITVWCLRFWWYIPMWLRCVTVLLPSILCSILFLLAQYIRRFPWEEDSINLENDGNAGCRECIYHMYRNTGRLVMGTRIVVCIVVVAELYIVYFVSEFRANFICMLHAVSLSIPLYLALYQIMWRLNFRRWANYVMAAADVVVYLALLDLFCYRSDGNALLLGLISGSRSVITKRISLIHPMIQGTIFLAPFLAVVKESVSSMFTGVSSLNASDLPQHRRQTRSRLLTHRWSRDMRKFIKTENTLIPLFLGQVSVFVFASFFVLTNPVIEKITLENGTVDLQYSLSINAYAIFAAMAIAATAFVSFWSVSDEHLIRSEYNYLSFMGTKLKHRDITISSARWIDYCQIMINLYTNSSGLESENRRYHELMKMICCLRAYFHEKNTCASLRFVTEILSVKGDRNAVLRREAHHNNDQSKIHGKSHVIRIAQDLQFARDMLALMEPDIPSCRRNNTVYDSNGKPQQDNAQQILQPNNPLTFIRYLTETFFCIDEDPGSWNLWFNARNVDTQEGIDLLKMDSILYILQRERAYGNSCGIKWLGCQCSSVSLSYTNQSSVGNQASKSKDKMCFGCDKDKICDFAPEDATWLLNRLELLIIYPFLIVECYKARWDKPANLVSFLPHFEKYYKQLFSDQIYTDHTEILPSLVRQVLNSLITIGCNLEWVSIVGSQFTAEFIPITGMNPDNDRICSVNYSRMEAMELNKNLFKLQVLYYSDTIKESTINDLFRLVYSIFYKPNEKNVKEGA